MINDEKTNMGLTTWKEAPDGMIYKYDVSVAKNYLNEVKKLNNLTTLFLDYAESMADNSSVYIFCHLVFLYILCYNFLE